VGVWAALSVVAGACGGGGATERLTVFAASSLTEAFQDAARLFEDEHPGLRVTLNFASSTALRTQLEHGARAGLFASADERQMDLARRAGVIDGEAAVFATNRLAMVVRARAGKIAGLEDLARPGVRLALTAAQTPIGGYTALAFERMAADPAFGPAFVARVRANAVTQALDARQAVSAVELGEADAALVYVTDARAGPALQAIPLPGQFNVVATYPIAVVRGAQSGERAREFIAFLRSERGQGVLERFGFGRPS